jgi:hypothetical protein
MRLAYYSHPPSGDFLAIDPQHWRYDEFGQRVFEGRGTAVERLITSVCTCAVGESFLAGCVRVRKTDVPRRWLTTIRA